MVIDERLPPALRDRVAIDLRGVRPLRRPWERVLALAPVGLFLLLAAPLVAFHVRTDVDRVSPLATWGVSFVQLAAGLALAGVAFRDVVPGRSVRGETLLAVLCAGAVLAPATMLATWLVSPVVLPAGVWGDSTAGCFRQSSVDGLPVLVLVLALASRGLTGRPAVVGALCGLAAGVVADASWRMVCVATQPSHVLVGHFGAVLALTLVGAVALPCWTRIRTRRSSYRSVTLPSHSLR